MASAKPKTVEVTLRVRVPKHWSAAHTKREIADHWYGPIYAAGPAIYDQIELYPRFTGARVIRKGKR